MQANISSSGDSASASPFRYEFGELESISHDVSDFIEMNWSPGYGLLDDFRKFIAEQVNLVKNNLVNTAFTFEDERYVERYIQYNQRALIRLEGNLLSFATPENLCGMAQGSTLLIQYLYLSLQDLLNFIEKHFSKYFDQNAWIPPSYRTIVVHEIECDLEKIRLSLLQTGITQTLVTIAMKPLYDFAQEENTDEVTYRKVIYLKELKRQLSSVTAISIGSDMNECLRSVLFYLNLNSPELYNHCISELSAIRDQADTVEDCIEQLALFQKTVKQVSLKPGFAFDPELPSLKKMICHWIDKEIVFQEKKKNLRASEEAGEAPLDHQIAVDMSVEKLAYIFRVLVEIQIVPRKLITRTFRVIARVFKTDRTQEMSAESVKNGYYGASSSTREAIKKLLLKMLEYVNGDVGTA